MRRLCDLGAWRKGICCGPIVLLGAASLLLFVPPGLAETGKPPAQSELGSLEKLWQQYPLETKAQPIKSRTGRVAPAAPIVKPVHRVNAVGVNSPVVPAADKSSVVPTWGIALAAIGLLLFTLVLTRRFRPFTSVVHIRPEGVAMPMFGDRKGERATPEDQARDHLMVSRVSSYTVEESDQTPSSPAAESIEETSDYAQLGEHVAAVLEAAQEGAKKIRLQATEIAQQVRADAELKVRVALEESQKQTQQAEADAVSLRAEAKQQSTKVREEAEAYASTTREAANTEAAAVLDRAEREASERVRASRARLHTLDENVAATERRLRQLVGKLRELASSLDGLMGVSDPSEEPESESAASQTERGSLTDALTPSLAEHRLSEQSTTSEQSARNH